MIEEHKIAYSPANKHLERLMERVAIDLDVKHIIEAANATHLAHIMTHRKIICAIEFHHEAVLSTAF